MAALTTGCCDVKFKNPALVKKLSEGNLEFALNLYQMLRTCDVRSNMSFSPLCLTTSLVMVWMGARNDTAGQIWDVLELGVIGEVDDVHRAFGEVIRRLAGPQSSFSSSSSSSSSSQRQTQSTTTTTTKTGGSNSKSKKDLHLVSRIYLDTSYQVSDEFDRLVSSVCATDVGRVDFGSGDPNRCRDDIDAWIDAATEGRVPRLLCDGGCRCRLDCNTRIVVVNAVHFRGTWLPPPSSSTQSGVGGGAVAAFYRRKFEEAVPVSMDERRGVFPFVVDYDFKCKVIELPCVGGGGGDRRSAALRMLLFLPFEVDGLAALENKLTPELIKFLKKSMAKTKLTVVLPQIRFSEAMPMSPALIRMGIVDLFRADHADLSGITGTKDMHLFELVHNVHLEASASPASVIRPPSELLKTSTTTSGIPTAASRSRVHEVAFVADHPFLFLIYDRPSKLILFMGRLADPTAIDCSATTPETMAAIQVKIEQY